MHKVTRLTSAGRSADYYGKDDYYISGEADAPGLEWGGEGAKALGFEGKVEPEDFKSLLQGFNPDPEGPALSKLETLVRGGMTLEQAEKAAPHAVGFDETFSAPKGVSLLDLVGEDERLAVAHEEAVEEAMAYAEEHFSLYRTREEDGSRREVVAGNLVYATTEHGLSREGDPQRHSHVVVLNMVQDKDGEWRALESKDIYRYSQLLGRIYQDALREKVQALGYDTVDGKTPGTFEIAGIDDAQLKAFSKRAAVLEEKFEAEREDKGRELLGQEKQTLRKIDRPDKLGLPRELVREGWEREAREVGLDLGGMVERARQREAGQDLGRHKGVELEGQVSAFVSRVWSILDPHEKAFGTAKAAVSHAVGLQEERTAVFRSHDVLFTAMEASNNAFSLGEYQKAIGAMQKKGTLLDADVRINAGVTTQRAVEIEAGLVQAFERNVGVIETPFDGELVSACLTQDGLDQIGAFRTPNVSQAEVVRSVLTSPNGIDMVQGYAGVGKTTTLDVLSKALSSLSDEEVSLKGLAPTHKAAQAMEREAGIEARTVAGFLGAYRRGVERHDLTDLKSEYAGQWLVVDEASQLGNRTMSELIDAKEKLGIAKLVITGDQRQLSSPEAGAPMRLLLIEAERHDVPRIELNQIIRQRDETLRGAIYELAEGKPGAALQVMLPYIRELGEGRELIDDRALVQGGIEAWRELKAKTSPEADDPKIVVATNAMRLSASAMIREERVREGEVAERGYVQAVFVPANLTETEKRNSRNYDIGQRLSFFSASKDLNVRRHADYEVTGLDHANNRIIAKGEGGKTLTFRLDETLKDKKLPYAVYDRDEVAIAAGDRMLWQSSDPKREIATNSEFEVVEVKPGYVRIRDDQGKEQTLSKSDPMLKHTTYAYALTADRAQGQTYGAAVTILSSRQGEMANNARAYVMASRPRDDLVLVTDNAKALFRSLAEHDGMNRIALEHVVKGAQHLLGDREHQIEGMQALSKSELQKAAAKAMGRDAASLDEFDKKEKELIMPPFTAPGGGRQRDYDRGM